MGFLIVLYCMIGNFPDVSANFRTVQFLGEYDSCNLEIPINRVKNEKIKKLYLDSSNIIGMRVVVCTVCSRVYVCPPSS